MSVHSRKQIFPQDNIKFQFSQVVYRPKYTLNISAIAEVIHWKKKNHQTLVVVILTVLLNTAVTGQLSQK